MKFKMPKKTTINSRITTVRNSAFNGILPIEKPDSDDIKFIEMLLKTKNGRFLCGYCGKTEATETDHINPLIIAGKPSGYIHEISNLIPVCGSCNSIKSNLTITDFFENDKFKLKVGDKLDERKLTFDQYTKYFENKYGKVVKLNFEEIIDEKLWNDYLDKTSEIFELMKSSSEMYIEIKEQLKKYYIEHRVELKEKK
ncbi:TPA: HNH endonuclease [Streptococcus suis]|uniref:HNH endonuclease n=1 Tax=Streptococcus suis TaxID=1307 RepID=A0AB33U4R7_STRSU|nr:HNH endonuclease signature motif containing protein [Streptococcus suis]NQH85634.1 HNH endonuclease [Streptococcus suis]NQN18143.1 HNH endonuclease [Streptococcus suis]CYU87155.1 HNH endonuclease [Streptococcus suis]HEL1951197.1 HNH endonuclease [Streptococcus suis]HEL2726824.1 HNH endonuclease [Streptococcus suis]